MTTYENTERNADFYMLRWPDTSQQQPPCGDLYECAVWLLGRHPKLAALAEQVPGIVARKGDRLTVALDELAETICALAEHKQAMADYSHRTEEPWDDAAHRAWLAAGPQPTAAVEALLMMNFNEQAQLALLASFASSARVPFSVSELKKFSIEDFWLRSDWCRAVWMA